MVKLDTGSGIILTVLFVVAILFGSFVVSGAGKVTFGYNPEVWQGKMPSHDEITAEIPMKKVMDFLENVGSTDAEGNKYLFFQTSDKTRFYAKYRCEIVGKVVEGDLFYQKVLFTLSETKQTKLPPTYIINRIKEKTNLNTSELAQPIEDVPNSMTLQELRNLVQSQRLSAIITGSTGAICTKIANKMDLCQWLARSEIVDVTHGYGEVVTYAYIFKATGTIKDEAIKVSFRGVTLNIPSYVGAITQLQGENREIEKLKLNDLSLPATDRKIYGVIMKKGMRLHLQVAPGKTTTTTVVSDNKVWGPQNPTLIITTKEHLMLGIGSYALIPNLPRFFPIKVVGSINCNVHEGQDRKYILSLN